MTSLAEIREKYPQYSNKSDQELADALHMKFYSHLPKEEFYSRINFKESPLQTEKQGWSGVGSDIMDKAVESLIGIPSALAALPSEISGVGAQLFGGHEKRTGSNYDQLKNEIFSNQTLGESQKRALKNIGAGLGNLGHETLSAFGNLRDYLVSKGIVSENAPSLRLSESILPKEYDYAKALGIERNKPGDALLQSAPGMVAGAGIGKLINPLLADVPITRKLAARHLNKVTDEIKKRNIKGIPVSEHLLEEAKGYLPENKPNMDLLERAKSGEYDPLFTLQSDIGKRARNYTNSWWGSERQHGFDMNDLRQRLLNEIRDNLTNDGHGDLAKLMKRGQNRYRQYSNINQYVYQPLKRLGVPIGGLNMLNWLYKQAQETGNPNNNG